MVRFGRPDDELRGLDNLYAAAQVSADEGADPTSRPPCPARLRWAQILARVYELDPLRCPGCGGTLRILAFLTDPPVVHGILRHLGIPYRAPRPGGERDRSCPPPEA